MATLHFKNITSYLFTLFLLFPSLILEEEEKFLFFYLGEKMVCCLLPSYSESVFPQLIFDTFLFVNWGVISTQPFNQ